MPIHTIQGLSLDSLAENLSKNLNQSFLNSKHPLSSNVIIIPNTNIRSWLQLKIAKHQEVAFNLQFEFFEKMILNYYLERGNIDKNTNLFETLNSSHRKILSYLLNNQDTEEIKPLKKYLSNISRAFSLSGKLIRVFEEYEFNRLEWIQKWAKDTNHPNIPEPPQNMRYPLPLDSNLSKLQENLYKSIFLKDNLQKERFNHFLLKERKNVNSKIDKDLPSVHIFCLTSLSDLYMQLLSDMSNVDQMNIYFYQFFTELPLEYHNLMKASPLRWAKSQIFLSERIRKISNSFTNIDENKAKNEKGNYNEDLTKLRDLLKGSSSNLTDAPNHSDINTNTKHNKSNLSNIQFWNAPSIYREVEAVAHGILHRIKRDRERGITTSFLDFSILVTDIKKYRPAIEWVFDGGILLQESEKNKPSRLKIPYSLTDLKGVDNSFLFKGLIDIFSLCKSKSIPKELFLKIFKNPIFGINTTSDTLTGNDIEDIFLRMGVFYQEENRESDPFQISNGLKRIRLSTIFNSTTLKENYKFSNIEMDSDESAIHLTDIWESFYLSCKSINEILSNGILSRDVIYSIFLTLQNLFHFEGEFERESENLHNWFDSLLEWEDFEFSDRNTGLDLINLITQTIFDKLPYRHGNFLMQGVSVSLLQPMRPIPFKHVYILGLGESKFPGSVDHSKIDLRKESPQSWDLTKKELQESLLWEALHSAKETITLSYVGQDTKEQKEFEPCSHFIEIMNAFGLESAITIPLHSYSEKYLNSNSSIYNKLFSYDFSLKWVNADDTSTNILLPDFQKIEELPTPDNKVNQITIPLRDLSKYLSDPLDTYLRKQMGMRLDDEDIIPEKGEFFQLTELEDSKILRQLYSKMIPDLTSQQPWQWDEERISKELDSIIDLQINSAQFPQGLYQKIEKSSLFQMALIANKIFQEWKLNLQGGEYIYCLSLGDTGTRLDTNQNLPIHKLNPLILEIQKNVKIELQAEWFHLILKDGTYHWIHIGTLDSSLNSSPTDFWSKNGFASLSNLALQCLGTNFKIHSIKSRPKGDGKNDSKIVDFQNDEEDTKSLAKKFLLQLTNCFLDSQPQFFPRMGFQNFYLEEKKEISQKDKKEKQNLENSTDLKNQKADPDQIIESIFSNSNSWKNYINDNYESIINDLSNLVKIYPNSRELLEISYNLDYAIKYYLPLAKKWKVLES
jgi:exodeoxyribonuclease V gamma subunit